MEFPEEHGARDFFAEPRSKHIMESAETEAGMRDDHDYTDDVAAVPTSTASDRMAADVVSLDTVRSAIVNNFEQDDLDVPAFLRKRNEVM